MPYKIDNAAPMARLRAGLAQRGLSTVPSGPTDTTPRPDEPGHPEYHRRIRTEWALARWETATPPRYRRAVADHPAVIAWADQTAQTPEEATALLLTGTTGTGKTHQAYGALRRIAESGPHQYEVIATTAADMYGLLRPNGSPRGPEAELRRLCRVPLLLLDDLGSAKATEWTEEVTYRLINERYNRCLPSIFTSNLPPRVSCDEYGQPTGPDLASVLGERIVSRVAEMTTVVAMTGADRRLTSRQEDQP
ncbi:ATP-binding protein [Streptomyces rimosus]|uniref:ATP-binding protein n=1 Tax=Streptomyces rimosus TaxID=1927 RepID=UPI0004CB9E22|nr:ATP-binding protein [Streptomyces rimosus]